MRALIIGPEERERINALAAFASIEKNWFDPLSGIVPGMNPNFVVHVPDGFRCVFTITKEVDGKLWRQLSISVPGERFPSPEACVMLGREFGFTSSDEKLDIIMRARKDGWAFDQMPHCIVMAQRYERAA